MQRRANQNNQSISPKPSSHPSNRSISQSKPTISAVQMCAVCLNEMDSDHVTLNCKHKFCSAQCAKGWWKFNQACPYCREQILYIQTKKGQKITRDDVSEESSENDDEFVPRCAQCWADIDEGEQKKVCISCSTNFIHKRCEMFSSRFWKCNYCLDNTDDEGRQVFPVIPYNPVIHYLVIQNLKK